MLSPLGNLVPPLRYPGNRDIFRLTSPVTKGHVPSHLIAGLPKSRIQGILLFTSSICALATQKKSRRKLTQNTTKSGDAVYFTKNTRVKRSVSIAMGDAGTWD